MSVEKRAKEIARMSGLGWRERISRLSREFGLPANEAAKALDPWYVSRKEAREMISENYSGMIDPQIRNFLEQVAASPVDLETRLTHVSRELGVSEKVAAELLYPYRTRL